MSFRKRNMVLSAPPSQETQTIKSERQMGPGLRPSPLDGRLTTSTGTASLDHLLAGHAGLPLGTSLFIEEHGTTDFAGALLRYYAAEGLVQGHQVHALGFHEAWKHELPSLIVKKAGSRTEKAPSLPEEKMKIAWRYEALGNRSAPAAPSSRLESGGSSVFCHSFDLTKRLAPSSMKGTLHAVPSSSTLALSFETTEITSPFRQFIKHLRNQLASSPSSSIHRVVVPSLLSPEFYTGSACHPTEVLHFLHALRALLRKYSGQLTVLVTLPVSLYPRGTGLTRWMEILSDGVLELTPLHTNPIAAPPGSSGGSKPGSKEAEKIQGMLKVHSMPIYHEKGGGGAEGNYFRENLSFSLSASKGLVIKPYSLPPLEDEGGKEKSPASTVKDSIEF